MQNPTMIEAKQKSIREIGIFRENKDPIKDPRIIIGEGEGKWKQKKYKEK